LFTTIINYNIIYQIYATIIVSKNIAPITYSACDVSPVKIKYKYIQLVALNR
jgi:hypothetical protein